MRLGLSIVGALALVAAPISAYSADWEASGRVTRIEPTFTDHLNIRIDATAGTCAAGGWLFFYGYGATAQEKKDSVKAVYAGLLASMHTGTSVVLYGFNQGCVVEQVHLLNN